MFDDEMNSFFQELGTHIPKRSTNQGLPASTLEVFDIDDASDYLYEKHFPFTKDWGRSMNLDISGEPVLNWCDLRELMVAEYVQTSNYFGNTDLYDLDALIRDYLNENLEFDECLLEICDEITIDLGFCAMNRKLNKKDNNFWSVIFNAYLSGVVPCGWHGEFPNGSLVVFKIKG